MTNESKVTNLKTTAMRKLPQTSSLNLNFNLQHPSAHGVLRPVLEFNGRSIKKGRSVRVQPVQAGLYGITPSLLNRGVMTKHSTRAISTLHKSIDKKENETLPVRSEAINATPVTIETAETTEGKDGKSV
jgi:hypothetical protein